ncbi:hypothetical protein ANN_18704, partial [Periplaneta americana]
ANKLLKSSEVKNDLDFIAPEFNFLTEVFIRLKERDLEIVEDIVERLDSVQGEKELLDEKPQAFQRHCENGTQGGGWFSEPTHARCEVQGPHRTNLDYTRDSEWFLQLRDARSAQRRREVSLRHLGQIRPAEFVRGAHCEALENSFASRGKKQWWVV